MTKKSRIAQKFGVTILAAACTFVGCGRKSQDSVLEYRVASTAYAGLLRKVHNTAIKICMANDSSSNAHKPDVEHAINEWTGALIDFAKEPVTQTTEFLDLGNSNCDAVVKVGNYSPAQPFMGNRL